MLGLVSKALRSSGVYTVSNMNQDDEVGAVLDSTGTFSAINTYAMPLEPRDVDGQVEVNDVSKSSQEPLPPPPPLDTSGADVTLRTPYNRSVSKAPSKSGSGRLVQSASASDLVRLRNGYPRPKSKDQKSVVLPIALPNRYRSPATQNYDVASLGGVSYGNSDQLTPYAQPADGNFFIYPNRGYAVQFANGPNGPLPPVSPSVSSRSHHKQAPTPTEAKTEILTDILSGSMSTMYAILIVTLGVSFYVLDYLNVEHEDVEYVAEGFSLTILIMALVYFLYLIIDISVYNHRKSKYDKLMDSLNICDISLQETQEGLAINPQFQQLMAMQKMQDHRYCFNLDRHSSNFYLKVGAAMFCFGHLIHSILILTYRGIIMGSEEETDPDCNSVVTFIIEILYPIYSITLLFFIFKYSNVIINKHKDFHRFGFMHCLSSSLCFWLWTIFRETAEYIRNSQYPDPDYNDTMGPPLEIMTVSELSKKSIITPYRFTAMCEHKDLNVIYHDYSPYLYPFSVEYSILVVGILYIVYVNVGLCRGEDTNSEHHHDTRECRNDRRQSEPESHITIHADCHASNKGLFLGFITLVFTIVSIILFFLTVYSPTDGLAEIGLTVNQSTRVGILFAMICAVVFAYFQMVKLDLNESAHNTLDNFLCLMCMPAFFVYGLFSLIPGLIYGRVLAVSGIIFEIIQVIIQTAFIMDGMSRSSNSKQLRKKKLGREFVTFLVICNVAMWIMQTFEVKSHGLEEYRQDFYSKEVWSILGHSCLPLMMFYRFHSSVCIGDIWKYAYMPSGH